MTGGNTALTPDQALAVLLDRTESQGKTLEGMAVQLQAMHSVFVSRDMWEQRNRTVDDWRQSIGRELAAEREDRKRADDATRAELASRRHPWPSVLAAILAAVAVGITIVNAIAGPPP